MNRGDVENGIRRSWEVLNRLALGETFSSAAALAINEEFRDLALNAETRYAALYMNGLSNSYYNILIADYSYFHFGWSAENHVRYAYYPNPFLSGKGGVKGFKRLREAVEADAISVEQYHALLEDELPECRVPLLRYENAPGQWRELRHPCSHFHIGHHSDNRWAINRVLTPLAFTLLVLKQYYSEEWDLLGDDSEGKIQNVFERELIKERFNCRIIGDDLFTANEASSFHLA